MAEAIKSAVVIIPTYNEKGNIERVIDILETEIFPQLVKYKMHILVVDDSSPDGTGGVVRNLSRSFANLHLLVNPHKAGLGNAYIKGMNYALTKLRAAVVFEFDADLSHDPTKIPIMLQKIEEGYDMVLGSRYVPGGAIPNNWGWHRKLLSIVGNLVARLIAFDFKIHDWTGGFRAITSEVVAKIIPLMTEDELFGYTFQIGFLLQARKMRLKIGEIPFHFKDRKLGKSKMPASYISSTLIYMIGFRVKELFRRRLFKFVVVGGIGALIQLSTLQLFRQNLTYQLAYFFSVEMAVISNFIWSNWWTFSDRKLKFIEIPSKFAAFNLTSAGSIIIQQILAYIGEKYIGLFPLFSLPVIGGQIDTGLIIAVTGILLGMTWNFFAYTRIIWRRKEL